MPDSRPPIVVEVHRLPDGQELRYDADLAALPAALARRFSPLSLDEAARSFLEDAGRRRPSRLRTGLYRALRRLVSDYDAYGLLGMYPMHLLSTLQFEALLGSRAHDRLLDVGAGNGAVTAQLAPLFREVWVSETSQVMRRRLKQRGFAVLADDLALTPPASEPFDVVTCLNVLDRCQRPRSLLSHLVASLAAQGTLVISLPLPLSPHVHVGAHTVDPDEPLPDADARWETGAARVASELLEPAGLAIQRLSRAPYLCHGDASRALYALDAALYVCTRSDG